jgi:hypothetical protein
VRVPSDQLHLVSAFANEPVTTSVVTSSLPIALEPMDLVVLEGCHENMADDGRVFLNVKTVRLSRPWRQVVAADLSKELVPMPLPGKDEVGRPFIIYSGTPSAPAFYGSVPGLHRKITWPDAGDTTFVNKKKNNAVNRRLMLTLEQFQWQTKAEANASAKPLHMRMPIWDDSCRQLFGGDDMRRWTSIITANPIPFWAVVSVDGEHSKPDSLSLSTLSVHWDLRTYLESSCLELTAEQTQMALGNHKSNKSKATTVGDIVNVTDSGVMPQGKKWRYYAMTANRATAVQDLQEPMVLFAVTTNTAAVSAASVSSSTIAKKPVKKKAKQEAEQEEAENKSD